MSLPDLRVLRTAPCGEELGGLFESDSSRENIYNIFLINSLYNHINFKGVKT